MGPAINQWTVAFFFNDRNPTADTQQMAALIFPLSSL
jgi:hypothetical protein